MVLLSLFFFVSFFKSYLDLLDLHSFPTRRSSDLSVPSLTATSAQTRSSSSFFAMSWPGQLIAKNEDRKSTRLNSSHTVISYAVFCLKKKKKKKKKTKINSITPTNTKVIDKNENRE